MLANLAKMANLAKVAILAKFGQVVDKSFVSNILARLEGP